MFPSSICYCVVQILVWIFLTPALLYIIEIYYSHWFPGFGIELVKMGYTMLDIVKYIPMEKIMSIYKVTLIYIYLLMYI